MSGTSDPTNEELAVMKVRSIANAPWPLSELDQENLRRCITEVESQRQEIERLERAVEGAKRILACQQLILDERTDAKA